jgi:hypothetical protein
MMKMLVPQKGLKANFNKNIFLRIIANATITSMIFFVVIADIVAWIYQEIYFGIAEIPKVPRRDFVVMTRHKLPGLTPIQRWSCWYCEYVNSVVAWIKALANQTEIYSCAIKYSHKHPGQEYQEKFYEQEEIGKTV